MQQGTIRLGEVAVPFRVERGGKAVRLRLADAGGPRLIVQTPDGRMTPEAEAFIRAKHPWILRHFRRMEAGAAQKDAFIRRLREGQVTLLGEPCTWTAVPGPRRRIQRDGTRITLLLPPGEALIPTLLAGLRTLAAHLLTARTQQLAHQTHSQVRGIRIKALRSKWGSCSGQGNVNLNWLLIFLPPELADYVIVHELMHLRELNHSDAFWSLVARHFPGYEHADQALKHQSWLIHAFDDPLIYT